MITSHIQQVQAISDNFFAENGRKPGMFIRTFGCQMNERESEKLHGLLSAMGYAESASEEEAELVLYNTCCVRESAENRVYGNLGYLKALKKIVVLCGCMPQRPEVITEIKRGYRHVNIIFGTFNKHHFPKLLLEYLTHGKQVIEILQDHSEADKDFDIQTTRFFPHKAGVTIMHGCNNYCSYCIVPHVRGREVSRPVPEIMQEIEALAADGVKEVMLLGQNVNSYEYGFADLIRKVNEVQGLERIRFMTSHPKDLSQDLIDAMRSCEKVCKQIHLPMQSGSSRILEAMNRGYTKEEYLALTDRLKGISISTDIIVGFPGESEEDFLDTLDAVKKAGFAGAFTFMYSRREGTPAADLTNELPKELVHERFNRLLEITKPQQLAHNQSYIGRTVTIMAEGESNKPGIFTGRADDNMLVHFEGSAKPGDMLEVEITGCKTFYAIGTTKKSLRNKP